MKFISSLNSTKFHAPGRFFYIFGINGISQDKDLDLLSVAGDSLAGLSTAARSEVGENVREFEKEAGDLEITILIQCRCCLCFNTDADSAFPNRKQRFASPPAQVLCVDCDIWRRQDLHLFLLGLLGFYIQNNSHPKRCNFVNDNFLRSGLNSSFQPLSCEFAQES